VGNVDYRLWLKIYNSELANAHPGVSIGDVDPRYIQSLFQKDLDPTEAAKLGVVYRDEVMDGPRFSMSNLLDRIHWDYAVGALGVLLFIGVIIGPRIAAHFRASQRPETIAVQGNTKSNGDFYASDELNIPATGTGSYSNSSFSGSQLEQPSEPGWPFPFGFLEPLAQHYRLQSSHANTHHSVAAIANFSAGDQGSTSGSQRLSSSGGSPIIPTATPVIQQFDVNTSGADAQGLTGTVSWTVTNADSVQILLLGVPISGATDLTGSFPFDSLAAGSLFTIRAIGGGHVVEESATADPTN
jgi:hypothetical protein